MSYKNKLKLFFITFLFSTQSVVGQHSIYSYDTLNRIIHVRYPDSSSITYTYDNGGNRISKRVHNPCNTKPRPTITTSAPLTFCNGDSVTLTTGPGLSYHWSNGDTIHQSITVLAGGDYWVTRLDTFSVPGSGPLKCPLRSDTVTVTVFAISSIAGATTVCAGVTTPLSHDSTGGVWTSSSTTVASVGSSTGLVNAVSAGTTTISYTLLTGCRATLVITVTPTPLLTPPPSQSLCNGASTTPINFTGSISTATYAWANDNTAIGLGAVGTGNIAAFTATNGTGIPVSATITVTPTAGGCVGAPGIFTITVKPVPSLSSSLAPPAICNKTTFIYHPASLAPGATFIWSRALIPGISNMPYIGLDSVREALINTTALPVPVTYTYSLTAAGCTNTQNVVVIVNPFTGKPHITTRPAATLCANTKYMNFGISSAPVPDGSYAWAVTNATILATGTSGQYCIVSFDNEGPSQVMTTSDIAGMDCISHDTVSFNVIPQASPALEVIRYHNDLICKEHIQDSYQWGYDDATTLDSTLLPNEVHQSFYLPVPDYTNKYYWVITTKDGCMQKTYFNKPTSSPATATINKLDMVVHPNPAGSSANITCTFTGSERVSIRVINAVGQLVETIADDKLYTGAFATQVATSKYPDGNYLIISDIGGTKVVRKFVVMK